MISVNIFSRTAIVDELWNASHMGEGSPKESR